MKKVFSYIISHSRAVLIITAILVCLGVYSITQTRINSDMSVYLSDDSTGKQTMQLLADDFGIHGDAAVCVQGELSDYEKISELVAKLGAVSGVDEVAWLGSYSQLFTISDGSLVSANPMIAQDKVQSITGNYFKTSEGKGYYLMSVALSDSNASKEASVAMDEYKKILADYSESSGGADYYLGGTVMQGKNMLDSAITELPKFLIIAVVVISLILLITSKSIVSALIFLLTIGISIILNMGSNFFSESVSVVTFSVASILQLALSMDYSIFLTYAYDREEKAGNPEALTTAIKKTAVVILASALTTVAGFCALFFMQYRLGENLGLCLAKGVSLSFLTVLIVQPCLMTVLKKACDRTRHKALEPGFEKYSKAPSRLRYVALGIAVVLLIPSIILSSNLKYYYLDTEYSEESTGAKGVLDQNGSQMVFVVPVESNDKQFEFLSSLNELKDSGKLTNITGFYSIADTLLGGISIPIYASENGGDVLATVDLSAQDIIEMLQSGGDLAAAQTPAITAAVTQAVEKASQPLIDRRIAYSQSVFGGSLTQAQIAVINYEVKTQVAQKIQEQLTAQLSAYSEEMTTYGASLTEMQQKFMAVVNGNYYTYYVVSVAGAAEGEEALDTVIEIEDLIADTFGSDTPYRATGSTQLVRELETVTTRDFVVVNIVSALLILIILIFTFKQLLLPLLMMAVIELAILLNMSFTALSGGGINFMTYVVISAIQMGATIDYAILLVKNYRLAMPEAETNADAVATAIKHSAFSIITSMSILVGACLPVYFVSSDKIIREITLMVARGSVISAALVLFILPALLSFFKLKKHAE